MGLNARKTGGFSWMRMDSSCRRCLALFSVQKLKLRAGAKRSCFFSPKQKERGYSRRKKLQITKSFGVSTFHERV